MPAEIPLRPERHDRERAAGQPNLRVARECVERQRALDRSRLGRLGYRARCPARAQRSAGWTPIRRASVPVPAMGAPIAPCSCVIQGMTTLGQGGDDAMDDFDTQPSDEAASDVALDGDDASDGQGDATSETAVDAAGEAGCGPLGTPANCSACGLTCSKTTGTASCNGIDLRLHMPHRSPGLQRADGTRHRRLRVWGLRVLRDRLPNDAQQRHPEPGELLRLQPDRKHDADAGDGRLHRTRRDRMHREERNLRRHPRVWRDGHQRRVRDRRQHMLLLSLLRSEFGQSSDCEQRLQHLLCFGLGVELTQPRGAFGAAPCRGSSCSSPWGSGQRRIASARRAAHRPQRLHRAACAELRARRGSEVERGSTASTPSAHGGVGPSMRARNRARSASSGCNCGRTPHT